MAINAEVLPGRFAFEMNFRLEQLPLKKTVGVPGMTLDALDPNTIITNVNCRSSGRFKPTVDFFVS